MPSFSVSSKAWRQDPTLQYDSASVASTPSDRRVACPVGIKIRSQSVTEIAVTNALVIGFLIIVAEIFSFSALGALEELIDLILGLWLLVSPWILSVSSPAAEVNFIIVGLLALALSIYELWEARRPSSS